MGGWKERQESIETKDEALAARCMAVVNRMSSEGLSCNLHAMKGRGSGVEEGGLRVVGNVTGLRVQEEDKLGARRER